MNHYIPPLRERERGDILVFTHFLYPLTFLSIESFLIILSIKILFSVERGEVQVRSRILPSSLSCFKKKKDGHYYKGI